MCNSMSLTGFNKQDHTHTSVPLFSNKLYEIRDCERMQCSWVTKRMSSLARERLKSCGETGRSGEGKLEEDSEMNLELI